VSHMCVLCVLCVWCVCAMCGVYVCLDILTNKHYNTCVLCLMTNYMLQYLFKGNKKVTINLNNTSDLEDDDEISHHQRGRMLCAMQAWYQIWGFQNYPASEPSVKLIKPRLNRMVEDLGHDHKTCDMKMYFSRPPGQPYEEMTFVQFFSKYDFKKIAPQYAEHTKVEMKVYGKVWWLYQRQSTSIIRMSSVPIQAGEIFWLRLLLRQYPAYSYEQLRTVQEEVDGTLQDVVCGTFQEAVIKLNLAEDKTIAEEMYVECVIISTPHELRVLFVNMALNGFPTLHIFNSKQHRKEMMKDLTITGDHDNVIENCLLKKLADLFKIQGNKLLSDFGMPDPVDQDTEINVERLTYNEAQQV